MPFGSEAQRRKFYAMEARGEIPEGTTARWERHTGDRDLPAYKHRNARNTPDDTFMDPYVESEMPFVSPDCASLDPNRNSSWGSVPDATFAATAMDALVDPDGSVRTREKPGGYASGVIAPDATGATP